MPNFQWKLKPCLCPSCFEWLRFATLDIDSLKKNAALSDPSNRPGTDIALVDQQADPSLIAEIQAEPVPKGASKFASFAWFVLIYNLAAVAWGVFVRASKSGDGGGAQWPLLDLSHQPINGDFARWVEGSHRVSTSLCGVFAIALVWMAFKNFPRKHQARLFSIGALGLTLMEGAIGAALVLFELVAENDSRARVGIMSFHVISTMLLVSSIALAAMAAMSRSRLSFRGNASIIPMGVLGMLIMFGLAVSGAVAALSHTLMPVDNVLAVAAMPDAHWLQKLQPLHPYISIAAGLFICLMAGMLANLRPSPTVIKACRVMVVTFAAQLLMGLVNVQLAAPIWMQMVHLVLGDVLFISMIIAVALALMGDAPRLEEEGVRRKITDFSGLVKGYVALTKPRVISLLLFTAGAAMFAAAKGAPEWVAFLAVMVGGYLSAGAANVMNMVVDRDIDGRMHRTADRPTVTHSISTAAAMNFALVLTVASFAILWAGSNLWAAMIALAGQAFYVCVYTLYLKRRTWQNIVIGGAAGSVPPMVGWVAVTGNLGLMAWWMFALIFIWTPVHFWALALLLKDDYAEAGVPMLPVAKGERATVVQISYYAALTVALSLLPVMVGLAGAVYLIGALALNMVLVRFCMLLSQKIERKQASTLFHYSMLYLALLFLVVAVDQRWLYAIS